MRDDIKEYNAVENVAKNHIFTKKQVSSDN